MACAIPLTLAAGSLQKIKPVTPVGGYYIAPHWGADGQLYCSTPKYADIMRINLDNGLVSPIVSGTGAGFGFLVTPEGDIFYKINAGSERELWRISREGKKEMLVRAAAMSLPSWYKKAVRLNTSDGFRSFTASGRVDSSSVVGWVYPEGASLFRLRSSGSPQRISSQTSEALMPQQSPDGERLVYSVGENLMMVNLTTGLTFSLGVGDHAYWSAPGDYLYFDRRANSTQETVSESVWRVNRDGANPENLTEVTHFAAGYPAPSPDGRRLAFEAGGRIWVAELKPAH